MRSPLLLLDSFHRIERSHVVRHFRHTGSVLATHHPISIWYRYHKCHRHLAGPMTYRKMTLVIDTLMLSTDSLSMNTYGCIWTQFFFRWSIELVKIEWELTMSHLAMAPDNSGLRNMCCCLTSIHRTFVDLFPRQTISIIFVFFQIWINCIVGWCLTHTTDRLSRNRITATRRNTTGCCTFACQNARAHQLIRAHTWCILESPECIKWEN